VDARVSALLAAAVLMSACGGARKSTAVGEPRDVGHGSVEDVGRALEEHGVPCRDPKPVPLPAATEQAVECVLSKVDEKVLLVHFFDAAGAEAFERQNRDAGGHGVYAETWAARTVSAEAARLIGRAVVNRGTS
jgi:hypothetical protein